MNGKETNGNIASATSSPAEEDEIVETPSTTEEAEDGDDLEDDLEEDLEGQDDPDSEQNMEVDPPSVTANPDKFQKLIVFGQKVSTLQNCWNNVTLMENYFFTSIEICTTKRPLHMDSERELRSRS